MKEPILEVNNLRVSFRTYNGKVQAVRGIDFKLYEGETLAIVGESGSGKSVSALSVMGLIPYPPGLVVGGKILFHGKDLVRCTDEEIQAIRGSKIGYTNIARYSYVCLAEQNGVRLICVTMQSEMKTDKYNDVRTLLDYAFARYTGYTDLPSQGLTGEVEVVGGGGTLGKVTVTDPGVRLLLADGVTAGDVSASLELPERYVLGTSPEVYAVYTVNGGDKQESTSVRVPAVLTGLDALLEANAGRELDTASDVKPARTAGMLIAISLACTAAAAGATLCVMRVMRLRKTKKQKPSQH